MPINGSAQILEIIDRQVLFNQEVINRYWYRLDAVSTPDLTALAAVFKVQIPNSLLSIQSDQLTHIETEIINHTDLTNYGTFTNGDTGSLTDPAILPPFVAFGIKLLRSSRDMRNGAKRIAGMQENYQDDGFLEPGILATVASAVGGMDTTLVESIRNYFPVIVRNRPTPSDPTIDPDDTSTWRYTFVSGVVVRTVVTTQNSRKFKSV